MTTFNWKHKFVKNPKRSAIEEELLSLHSRKDAGEDVDSLIDDGIRLLNNTPEHAPESGQ